MVLKFEAALHAACQPEQGRDFACVTTWASTADGSKHYLNTVGTRSVEDTKPATDSDVFWIASLTKLVTGLAAVQCVEKGLFALDNESDVARLLPEFTPKPEVIHDFDAQAKSFRIESASRLFTLRELLTHTSGLAYDFTQPPVIAWRESRGEPCKWLAGKITDAYMTPLVFEPGTSWLYGSSFEWIGRMIERATGLSLGDYFEQNIFRPLKMTDTTFELTKRPDLATRLLPMTSRFDPSGNVEDGVLPLYKHEPFEEHCGGLGLYSTASDYSKILHAVLNRDKSLLNEPSWDLAFQPLLSGKAKESLDALMGGYGPNWQPAIRLGLKWNWCALGKLVDEGLKHVFSPGALLQAGVTNCLAVVDPKAQFSALFLTQMLLIPMAPSDSLRAEWYEDVGREFGVGDRL